MSLKLFRSTGYSSFLMPGEARLALHPAWVVLAASTWIGLAGNLPLWRVLGGVTGAGSFLNALLSGFFVSGICGALLSLLGWRRTFKPAATVLLMAAALAACGAWAQALPAQATLLSQGLDALALPSWASLLRWQVPALFIVLAVFPVVWLWKIQLRRLSGPLQMRFNAVGMATGLAIAGASAVLLSMLAN